MCLVFLLLAPPTPTWQAPHGCQWMSMDVNGCQWMSMAVEQWVADALLVAGVPAVMALRATRRRQWLDRRVTESSVFVLSSMVARSSALPSFVTIHSYPLVSVVATKRAAATLTMQENSRYANRKSSWRKI